MTNSKSAALYQRACKVMPGGNTRTTVFTRPHPIYALKGQGCRITDVDGREYIDFINNYTSLIHGYGHPQIIEAVTAVLQTGTAFPMPTESEIALAELLCSRVPSFERIRFTNSGTEAVMMAIKAARAYTGRPKIVKCEGSYHGSYDFAEISLSPTPEEWGDAREPRSVPYCAGTPQGVLNDVIVIPYNDVEAAELAFERHAEDIAAVLVDPLSPRLGLIPATPEFLAALRRLTKDAGSLLISDEVISFRLGSAGAQGVFEFTADLTALGKIIGGGFPVGAVAGREEVMAVFDPSDGKPLVPHGGTFSANPVTMTAGRVAMELLTEAEFSRLEMLGERVRQGLRQVLENRGIPGSVTGMGSLAQIHMTPASPVDYRSAYPGPEAQRRMDMVWRGFLDRGIFLASRGLIALSTPMGEAEIDRLIEAFDEICLSLAV